MAAKHPKWVKAEAEFKAALAHLGCLLLEPYAGSKHRHHVRCPAGHDSYLRPNWLQQGNGACKTCSGKDSAEGRYRAYLSSIGATPAWSTWVNVMTDHPVICAAGHECTPRPNTVLSRRQGVCVKCSGRDTWSAEEKFKNYLTTLGAAPAWDQWRGLKHKHQVTCSEGHRVDAWPAAMNSGQGICRICAGCTWDVFYVVSRPDAVKFGITSGDPRGRLGAHRRDGFTEVHRVFKGLPDGCAWGAEQQLKAAMDNIGYAPLGGSREYFHVEALDTILGLVDNHLGF